MKIRKQTYSLDQYLKLMQNETIRTDQECQRLSGQWNPNMVNELISTVLTGNYIPPVILGEETVNGITRQWIIDGLQRSSSLLLFKYGNKRITRNVDEFMVTYQRKMLDKDGNVKRDADNEIIWESVEFDIRNKTYNQLPEELQDKFNECQIETVIHQDCDITDISKLVKKFNNHVAMNSNQRAFTYLDNFASDVRQVTENRFFLDIYSGNSKGKLNGVFERLVVDMVLLCNYPDHYKKNLKTNFEWLNENASLYDFESVNGLLTRLTNSLEITEEIKELFNVKHAYLFVAVFKEFIENGRNDSEFGKFLYWFVNRGYETEINGKTWNDWNTNRSSRDISVVLGKLNYLVSLTNQYSMEIEKVA
jgi:hypothetical protein